MRAILGSALLLFALTLVPACSEDDPATPEPADRLELMSLTSRVAVLNNIEYAYIS